MSWLSLFYYFFVPLTSTWILWVSRNDREACMFSRAVAWACLGSVPVVVALDIIQRVSP